MRFLVLYGLEEDFDLAKAPDVLVRLVEGADITPKKMTCFIPEEGKERRRTIYKKSKLIDVVSPFSTYEWIALDDPIDGNFLNVRSQLRYDRERGDYMLAKNSSDFGSEAAIDHLRLVCRYVTPRYGFSHVVAEGSLALFFPFGVSVVGTDYDVSTRIADLGRSRRVTKEHLSGKLHDVYGLNVLSPLHLERQVEGLALSKWIREGKRGELLEIKEDVFAWIVPDCERPLVRECLFRDGALIATV